MSVLVGTPSDDVPEILATGHCDITTVFLSMTGRHPEGRDAGYIEWHCLDHRPEMHRLASMRASLRLVSTPACRKARAASDAPYDDVDHMMIYLMNSDTDTVLEEFRVLNFAMLEVGRTPFLLPMIQRAVYRFGGIVAAPRIKVGADVLPWWPPQGVYVILEHGAAPVSDLVEVPGVAGTWWASGVPKGEPFSTGADNTGLQIACCYLDDDPVETAERLRRVLEQRWADGPAVGLLAAPFHTVVPYEWGRYVP
jgi:hypothetical protein